MHRLGLLFPTRLLILLFFTLLSGCGFGDRTDILLLVRAGDPVSRAIAEDYAAARDVPANQILELSLSTDLDAVEIDAATYLLEIADPIERHLKSADPDGDIAILITTRGLPLRIGYCDPGGQHSAKGCRSAAVDAALAQLGRTGDEAVAFRRVENPFFRSPQSFERFRRDSPDSALRFLVARLTAPTTSHDRPDDSPRALLDMIDRRPPTTRAAMPPLWRVFSESPRNSRSAAAGVLLDSIEDQLPLFGHRVCDACPLPEDAEALERGDRATGIVLQLEAVEEGKEAMAHPDEDPDDRLAYPGFVIRLDGTPADRSARRGSHSSFDRFVTRWLTRGAGAISTHLAGPSLPDVTRPTAQLIALARGSSAIEAHFKSVPQLAALNVFVGDPLLVLPDEALFDGPARDQDHDGVADATDNCRYDPNPDQRDTNADGLGNLCDPDVDNDGRVDSSGGTIYPVDRRGDLEAISLTARNGPYNEDHDLDGDGRVNERDVVRAQLWLGRTPGR